MMLINDFTILASYHCHPLHDEKNGLINWLCCWILLFLFCSIGLARVINGATSARYLFQTILPALETMSWVNGIGIM